ncbi:MAG TPA: hypothetical protein VKB16_11175 [Beijerinckiaceae bacterium]|nr:hypothetical protein [Beijerinckiaceae bacterium]
MYDDTPQSLGGKARSEQLSPEERQEIARRGAEARWGGRAAVTSDPNLPKATHQGQMTVGSLDLDCYVLEDGRRVFHKRGMARALGMKSGGGNVFVRAMRRKGLGSELDQKLVEYIENPINFKPLTQDLGHGYEANVLVEVCKAIIRASDAGKLTQSQEGLAAQARILLQAFAKVGVTALIDEATGFQQVRAPDALRILVQQHIEEEKRQWEKQFPDEYYDELNRVYGSRRLTTTTHQHLTHNYGIEKLKRQVQEVLTLIKVSDTVGQFKRLFAKRFPQAGTQLSLLDD